MRDRAPLTVAEANQMRCDACGHQGFSGPKIGSYGDEYGEYEWLTYRCKRCGNDFTTQTERGFAAHINRPRLSNFQAGCLGLAFIVFLVLAAFVAHTA